MSKSNVVKMLALVLVLALAIPSMGIFAQDGTVVDVIADSDNHATLATAVGLAGLEETLAMGEYTVFAPGDDAFAALPETVLNAALSDTELLSTLLTYHVVEGTIMSGDLEEGCTDVETIHGDTLNICSDGMAVTVNSATVTAADLEASNGVVHVIDRVVIPTIDMPEINPGDYSGEIVTAGSSTVGPLSVAMATRWNEEGGVDTPSVDIIGSGAGFERFCVNAETDISNASRPIKDSEVESCRGNGREPIEFRVGTDAVAVTVSVENDFVDNLSLEQLATAFSTPGATWADLDPTWPDEPIQLFIPGTDSGTFDFFVEVVLDENEEAALAPEPQMSENDDVLVTGISESPYAIGYFGYAYYINNQDVLRILSIDGITANAATVDSFEYPLARPLFNYSDAEILRSKPQVAAFLGYYLTHVNEEITEVGYFPASSDALNLARLQWVIAVGDLFE